jgi:hypothetical protein
LYYLPALGAFLREFGEVDVLIGVLLAMFLTAHLHEECIVGHASLWLFSFIGGHLKMRINGNED